MRVTLALELRGVVGQLGQLAEHVRQHRRIQSSNAKSNRGMLGALTWQRARSSRRQGDAEHLPAPSGSATVVERLHVVGQRRQDVPAEAAGRQDVVGCRTPSDASTINSSSRGSTTTHQRGVRRGRADQPGARLVDRQPQVGHGVEVEILEGADGTDQRAQHREVLQPCSNMHLDSTVASLALVTVQSRIGHMVSRQCLIDTTPALQLAFDRLIEPVSHDSRRVFHPIWTGLTRPTHFGRVGSSASRSSPGSRWSYWSSSR